MNSGLSKYLLSSVLRAPEGGAAAAEATPASDAAPAAAAEAPSPSSPAEAAAATPPVETPAAAAPEAAAPAPDAAPAAPAADTPKSEPSLLEATAAKPADTKPPASTEAPAKADAKPSEGDKKPAETKPAEAKAEAKPADAKPQDAPKPEAPPADQAPAEEPQARQYDAFQVPDGIKLGDTEVKQFTEVLGKHNAPQELGQELMNLYVDEVRRIESVSAQRQLDVWKQQNEAWVSEWKSDPELGGNRMETVLGRAKSVIEQFGGTTEEQTALLKMLSATGMGNFKGMGRLLNNVYDALGEPSPVPATAPGQRPRSWREKAYGDAAKP